MILWFLLSCVADKEEIRKEPEPQEVIEQRCISCNQLCSAKAFGCLLSPTRCVLVPAKCSYSSGECATVCLSACGHWENKTCVL